MHANKGHVKVDDANNAVTEQQSNVCSEQPSHGVTEKYYVRPLVFMWCQPDSRKYFAGIATLVRVAYHTEN